ncbi:hypothetical protein CCAX7_17550 [Capsulimonas corticalis]|uniref:Uncharacterized protein n=1 Tax=Capsulimonas corticalis TaxID=2219043 RepID=A0A402D3X3_9BACT|nr:hypothetical protein [Capsulimonas corticalis]BDI29704.1 hypothetical protein CCAX7_17550 [Capsulimonas corticalis]
MYATPMPYEEFAGGGFSFMTQIRVFGSWTVWSTSRDFHYLLCLVNDDSREALLCEYEDSHECFADIKLLRRIPASSAESEVSRRPHAF